ncbi:hypothetical protein CTEN210_09876 [Chaetoceros tenuissimus]|uniref:Centrosomal protein of 19 kDa n=1 Tax=Chaetoceros tenuissimus TaxID=426638 RepID=A0AAD3CYM8_9STRA|nr:hypothetical protein CTEN210_09876 [Chaetoceros tenuissimus]
MVFNVTRIGLSVEPAAFIVEFKRNNLVETALFHKRINVHNLTPEDSPETLSQQILQAFPDLLRGVQMTTMKTLFQVLLEKLNESAESDDGDLNQASDDQLILAKAKMNVDFESNRLTPNDPDYVFDKRQDFEPMSDSSWD